MQEGYRDRRKAACQKLFSGFVPDTTGARKPLNVVSAAWMAADGMFSAEIAGELGISAKAVQKIFRRYNFPVLHNFEPARREEKASWKGGKKMMKGYEYQLVHDHPNGTKHGNYVATHRLVVEKKLGRYLLPTEVVDHIDGDITNNDPENLRVFPSNGAHLAETLAGKCPNWTKSGLDRLAASRKGRRRHWKGVPR